MERKLPRERRKGRKEIVALFLNGERANVTFSHWLNYIRPPSEWGTEEERDWDGGKGEKITEIAALGENRLLCRSRAVSVWLLVLYFLYPCC